MRFPWRFATGARMRQHEEHEEHEEDVIRMNSAIGGASLHVFAPIDRDNVVPYRVELRYRSRDGTHRVLVRELPGDSTDDERSEAIGELMSEFR